MKVIRKYKFFLVLSIICSFVIGLFGYKGIIIMASGNPVIAPSGTLEVKAGEQIDIPMQISNNSGIMGFGFSVSYDGNYVEPVSVKAGKIISGGSFIDSIGTNNTQKKSQFNIFWSDVENMTSNGELFILRFKVKDNSSFNNTIIKVSNLNSETFNENWEDVVPEFEDIKLVMSTISPTPSQAVATPNVTDKPSVTGTPVTNTPEAASTPDVATPAPTDIISNKPYTLYGNNIVTKAGEQISIPISLINNYGVMGIGINVEYDKEVLTPIDVQRSKLLSQGNFSDSIQSSQIDGSYKLFWSDTGDMNSEGEIFTLNFKVADELNVDSTFIRLLCIEKDTFDENWDEVKLICDDIKVSFDDNILPTTPAPSAGPDIQPTPVPTAAPVNQTNVSLVGPNKNLTTGEIFDIAIVLEDNKGFANISYEISYDADNFELIGVSKNEDVGAIFTKSQYLTTYPYVVSWNSFSNVEYNGELAVLKFKVREDAVNKSYSFGIDYYKGKNGGYIDGNSINYDENCNSLNMGYTGCNVTVYEYIPGDINGDRKVNNQDATCLLRYLAGWDEIIVENALDVNGDGKINSRDATRLLQYLVGWDVIIK